jgi:hypothetical protein
MQKNYKNWLIKAPLGLVLVGFGACLIVEAGFLKHSGAAAFDWIVAGTTALVVFNSGLCIFGDAILARVRYEIEASKLPLR